MIQYSVVGKPVPRVDGLAKLSGQAKYTTDVVLPGMVYGKILRSPHPHARIVGIDTSRAEKLPGVEAVITGRDTLGIRYGFVDTPSYPAEERPLAEDKVRFIGESVAAVAAVDPDVADDALDLIEVEYDPLPAVFDPEEAMKEGAPQVHGEITRTATCAWEDWGVAKKSRSYTPVNNVAGKVFLSQGDVDEGFNLADYVREDRFWCPATAHVAMEPHAIVASYDPLQGKLDVWINHMAYEIKRYWLSKTLGIPNEKVRVHQTYVGGAFGGKAVLFDYEVIAAFLSRRIGRPVKIELAREDVFTSCRNSIRFDTTVKTGVKKDGTIVAQRINIIVDAGAYKGSSAVALFLSHTFGDACFDRRNVRHEGVAVYTNKNFGFAKRGHGSPQTRFAVDSQMDMICEDLGLDPVEVMLKNVRKKGDVLPNGDTLGSYGLPKCIRLAAEAIGWKEKRGKQRDRNRGVGIGVNGMFSGSGYWPYASSAIIRLNHNGTVTLMEGDVEFGQGADTACCQIAAEELGLPLEDVTLIAGDSELCPLNYSNFLSGGVFVGGGAVLNAARDLRQKILNVGSEVLKAKMEELDLRNRSVFIKAEPEKSVPLGDLLRYSIQKHQGDPLIGVGYRKAVPEIEFYPSLSKGTGRFTDAYGFTGATAEVEVDRETGKVKVLKIVVADDVGFEINPVAIRGQMLSQAVMGMGDALLEEVIDEGGRVLNPTLVDYEIPRALDVPEIVVLNGSDCDPKGPYGAKEAGECARAAVIPAIANAIYDAVGVRVHRLPITPEKLLNALRNKEK